MQKQMSENQLSFDNNNSNFKRKKLFKRNNSNNLKETKDIFILKQDAYLLKLLEKKIKLKKIYKSKKLNQKVIRLINPRIYKDTHDENNTSGNFKNKKINQNINYRNIIIRRDKKQTINNSFIIRENEKGNTVKYFGVPPPLKKIFVCSLAVLWSSLPRKKINNYIK